jgi:hypothetical protein
VKARYARWDVVPAGQRADRGPRSSTHRRPARHRGRVRVPAGNPSGPRGIAEATATRRCGSKGPSNPAAVPWTPESPAADYQEAKRGESDGNSYARPFRPARPEASVRLGVPEVVMKTFQELLDSGWGGRHLDPMTGGCPGCGAGELVIVEDAEHELKLFCRGCNRCWSVDGNRLHHVDPVRCPGCSQQAPCFDRFRHDVPQWGTWNT